MNDIRPIAIITGAYGGMGRACARQLGNRAKLILCDMDSSRLEAFAENLEEEGYTVVATVAGDLSEPGLAEQAVAQARKAGMLQVVAHAAGVSPSLGTWDIILRANIVATERLLTSLEAALEPGLVAALISSMAGHLTPHKPEIDDLLERPLDAGMLENIKQHLDAMSDPNNPLGASSLAYGISKRAVLRTCEARAPAWGSAGARIVSISPGLISTPMGRAEAKSSPGAAVVAARTPVQRWGTALDIAYAVDFLTSDRATFISGTDLRIDGGVTPALRGGAS